MKLSSKISTPILSIILLLGVSAAAFAQKTPGFNNRIPESILTPDHVETPIGDLNFFDGMPDKATVRKLYDNLLFMRGVETFLSGIPATSIEAIRLGNAEVGATPKAPEGKEANWIQTMPGKGWFGGLRLYGPLEPWFDKTWRPGEIELVK